MSNERQRVGTVQSVWLYPVKSMQGNEVPDGVVSERGLVGDRGYGLIDRADGKVVSAKNPRKWPGLFDFRAAYVERPRTGAGLPAVRITLRDGSTVVSDQPDLHRLLSAALGRDVELRASPPPRPILEQFWPKESGDVVTDERMPDSSFFDLGPLHVLTTATLDQLHTHCPGSDLNVRRFRPNVVIASDTASRGFAEQGWVGHTLRLGQSVRVHVSQPTQRCVMTTLAQPGLPADGNVLRAAARHAAGNVGVYAAVIQGGVLRRDDLVWLE